MARSQGAHWRPEDYHWNVHTLAASQALARQSSGQPLSSPPEQTPVIRHTPAAHTLVILSPSVSTGGQKRLLPLQCQVEGCNAELGGAKEYYQRYRICAEHLKLSSLIKDGLPQRFCQQCGRFHLLAEFDGHKRSCRARLDDHNNRRRKRLLAQGIIPQGRSRSQASDSKPSSATLVTPEPKPATPPPQAPSTRRRKLSLPGDAPEDHGSVTPGEADAAWQGDEKMQDELQQPHAAPAMAPAMQQELAYAIAGQTRCVPQGHAAERYARGGSGQQVQQHASSSSPEGLSGGSIPSDIGTGRAASELLRSAAYQKAAASGCDPAALSDEMLVRYLSDPELKQWAGQAQLSSKLAGAHGHLPASLDWASSRGGSSGLIGTAANASVRDALAHGDAPTEAATSLSVARSLTSMRSMARNSLLSGDASNARYHSISDPIMGMAQSVMRESIGEAWPQARKSAAAKEAVRLQQRALGQAGMPLHQPASAAEQAMRCATWPNPGWPVPASDAQDFGSVGPRHGTSNPSQFDSDRFAEAARSLPAAPAHRAAAELPEGQLLQNQSLASDLSGQSLHPSLPGISEAGHMMAMHPPAGSQALPGHTRSGRTSIDPSSAYATLQQQRQLMHSQTAQQQAQSLQQRQQDASLNSLQRISSRYQLFDRARSTGQPLPSPGHGSPLSGSAVMHDSLHAHTDMPPPLRQWQEHAPHTASPMQLQQSDFDAAVQLAATMRRPQTDLQQAQPHMQHAHPHMSHAPSHTQRETGLQPVPGYWQRDADLAMDLAEGDIPHVAAGTPLAVALQRQAALGASYAPDMQPYSTLQQARAMQERMNAAALGGQAMLRPPRHPQVDSRGYMSGPDPHGMQLPVFHDTMDEAPMQVDYPVKHEPLDMMTAGRRRAAARPDPSLATSWQMLRVSAKLGSARPDQLPPDLRQNFLDAVQSPWAEHTMQGTVRPGCTNLILGALEPGSMHGPCDAAAAARRLMATNPDFWRDQLVTLQLPSSAVIVSHGVITHYFLGKEMEAFQPPAPRPETLAYAAAAEVWVAIPEGCLAPAGVGPLAGASPCSIHLLGRMQGRLIFDLDLLLCPSQQRVRLPTADIDTTGLLWLEIERDTVLSAPVPILMATNVDVAEEVLDLEEEIIQSRMSDEAVEQLLLKLGSVLEFAEPLVGRMPPLSQPEHADASANRFLDERLSSREYTQAMVNCARYLLAECCRRSWPALAAKVACVAAIGCKSFGEVISSADRYCAEWGGLLCTAVHQGCLSTTGLLLDLQDCCGFEWDLTQPKGRETALHVAARLDDEGCMAGLLLTRCSQAQALWSCLANAQGDTPACIVLRLAASGRQWSYLSPAERAAAEERMQAAEMQAAERLHSERSISLALSDASPLSPMPSMQHEPARRPGSPLTPYDASAASESAPSPLSSDHATAHSYPCTPQAHSEDYLQCMHPSQTLQPAALQSKFPAKGSEATEYDLAAALRKCPPCSSRRLIQDLQEAAPHRHDGQWQKSFGASQHQAPAHRPKKSFEQLPTPFAQDEAPAFAQRQYSPALFHTDPAAIQRQQSRLPQNPLLASLSAEYESKLPLPASLLSTFKLLPPQDHNSIAMDSAIYETACSHIMQSWDGDLPDGFHDTEAGNESSDDDEIWAPANLEPRLSDDLSSAVAKASVGSSGMPCDMLQLIAEDNSASDFDFGPPTADVPGQAPLASPTRSPEQPQEFAEFLHQLDPLTSMTLTSSLTTQDSAAAAKGRGSSRLMDSAQELATARKPQHASWHGRAAGRSIFVKPHARPVPPSRCTSMLVVASLLALVWSGLLCEPSAMLPASALILARAAIRHR